jgi:hypothetical protein
MVMKDQGVVSQQCRFGFAQCVLEWRLAQRSVVCLGQLLDPSLVENCIELAQ